MGLLSRLAGLFSGSARDDGLLLQAIEHAKNKRPEKAIAIYDSLLARTSISGTVRARALFNRALAHSSMKDDEKALVDLEQLLTMPDLPENVQNAAKAQVLRVRKRSQ
jgi:tetratricopeptide (TPR) repeat protein